MTDLLKEGGLGVSAGAGFYTHPDADGVAQTRDRLLSSVLGALSEAKS